MMNENTIIGKSFMMSYPDRSKGDTWSEGGWIGKVIYTRRYIDTGNTVYAIIEDALGYQHSIDIDRLDQDKADADFESFEHERYYGDQE